MSPLKKLPSSIRRVASIGACLVWLALASQSQKAPVVVDRAAVHDRLAEPCREWRDVPVLQASLVELGPGAVAPLFDVYASRSIDNASAGSVGLGRKRLVAVGGALELVGKDVLFAHCRSMIEAGSVKSRRAALELASRLATPSDLSLLSGLAAPPKVAPADVLTTEWNEVLQVLVTVDVSVERQLGRALGQLPEPLRAPTIRFLGGRGTNQAFHAILEGIGSTRGLDSLLLLEVLQGLRDGYRPDDWEVGKLTSVASSASPETRALLANVFEALRDARTVPVLLQMIDEGSSVRAPAARALSKIAVLNVPGGRNAWREWHEREQAWYGARWSKCSHRLRSSDFATAADALREMATHPLFAHEVADELEDVLHGDDAELMILGCSALAHMKIHGHERELIRLLAHEHAGVRAAADVALERITGETFSGDPALWRTWLEMNR